MSSHDEWGDNMEFVDSELGKYLRREATSSQRVSVMVRPTGERERTIELLEEAGGRNVEPLATESISVDISVDELERLMQSSTLEAVELVRPIHTFDSGN